MRKQSDHGFEPLIAGSAGGPLYRRVKLALMHAIEDGRLTAGGVLPSETELSLALGVSIGTLRRAVDELVAEHILARRQGRGTYVALHTNDDMLFRFFHVERRDGLREHPQVELLTFERTFVDEEVAQALEIPRGDPAFAIDNRMSLQGRPVIHDRVLLPALLFKGLTEKRFQARPSSIYHLYQTMFGITVTQTIERARAVLADRTSARILGMAIGDPALQIRRVGLTFGDRPVEYRISTVNTANHDYMHHLAKPAYARTPRWQAR